MRMLFTGSECLPAKTLLEPEHAKPAQQTPSEPSKAPTAKQQSVAFGMSHKSLPKMYQGRQWSLDIPLPYQQLDAEDVSFKQVDHVIVSWAQLEKIPDYLTVGGVLLMRKMFELDVSFRIQYGFQENADPNDPAVYQSPQFVQSGILLLAAVDKAVDFLGPDLEPLETDLRDLGRRHIHMGALPEHWPVVGTALFHVLEQMLGDQFTEKIKASWDVVYHFLAYNMIIGLLSELSERQSSS